MATTSLWRVHGWLGKVLLYVENPDKTENPGFYPSNADPLSDVIGYAMASSKTGVREGETLRRFVSGVNCFPDTAREEMLAVKRRFGKENGTVAYHGYQSFAPGEATPEIAHEIGVKLAQQLWGERYQVLVATHLDRENHLHSHFVINTVSFVDGVKFHRTAQDYRKMREVSDALCRAYGLSVVEQPQRGRTKPYPQWRDEQAGKPGWYDLIRADLDEAVGQSMTLQQFWQQLRLLGYEVKPGKHIAVRPPGKERFVRLGGRLGEDYTVEAIGRRILSQNHRPRPLPEPEPKRQRRRLRGSWNRQKKATGFRALYYHYCYLLGYFPKGRRDNPKRLHFLFREDLLKLERITQEIRLLTRHRIDTAQQLLDYRDGLEREIDRVSVERGRLRQLLRTVSVRSDEAKRSETGEQIAACTAALKRLRKEVRLCEDIARRSGVMQEKLRQVRRSPRQNEKEMIPHEQYRRRGGTGR